MIKLPQGNSAESSFGALAALEKQKSVLLERKLKLEKEKEDLSNRVSEAVEKLEAVKSKKNNLAEEFHRMEEIEKGENKK